MAISKAADATIKIKEVGLNSRLTTFKVGMLTPEIRCARKMLVPLEKRHSRGQDTLAEGILKWKHGSQ